MIVSPELATSKPVVLSKTLVRWYDPIFNKELTVCSSPRSRNTSVLKELDRNGDAVVIVSTDADAMLVNSTMTQLCKVLSMDLSVVICKDNAIPRSIANGINSSHRRPFVVQSDLGEVQQYRDESPVEEKLP